MNGLYIHNGIDLNGLHDKNRSAYIQLFKVYYADLCFFAERIIGDDHAEDIVGNVFLKLWEKARDFESEYHLRSFLYRAVKNGCLNFIKLSQRAEIRNQVFYEERIEENDPLLMEIMRAEIIRKLYLAVEALPPQTRKIIKLTYLKGKTNKQAADHMALSIQTVKNLKTRGLSALKKNLSIYKFSLLIELYIIKELFLRYFS